MLKVNIDKFTTVRVMEVEDNLLQTNKEYNELRMKTHNLINKLKAEHKDISNETLEEYLESENELSLFVLQHVYVQGIRDVFNFYKNIFDF